MALFLFVQSESVPGPTWGAGLRACGLLPSDRVRAQSGMERVRGGSGAEFELVADEGVVGAFLGDERGVVAFFHYLAAVNHDDLVGVFHRG